MEREVLIADDNRLVAQVTGAIMEQAGYKVEYARDGIEAATKAYSHLPDLVILDIEMPKIKGYQVCRLLKEDPMTFWIPIIMLTGREHQSDMFWGLKTGADAYITKGFKPEQLVEKAEELVARSEVHREAKELARKRRREVTEEYVIAKITDLLDRKLFETTILNDIASLSGSLKNLEETVVSVFRILASLFAFQVGILLLLDEREAYVYPSQPVGTAALEEAVERTVEVATGYAWDKGEDDLKTVVLDHGAVEEDIPLGQAFFHLPLTAQKRVYGILAVAGQPTPAFRRDAPSILSLVSNELSMILDNARLYEEAKKLAITDGLTRIYNHRFFQELFDKEFKRADRYNTVFSLIMLDIDHFKNINDTYGHLLGDEILKEMAMLIKGCLRSMDVVARYGGEEFAILLPETELEDAIQTAERIRMAVKNHEFGSALGKRIAVTVSQGVTSYPSPGIYNKSDMVAKADAALYQAKESGRDRVCFRE